MTLRDNQKNTLARDKTIGKYQPVAAKDYHPDCRAALIQIVALQHTTLDQGGLVRDYTKWDDQPASPEAAVESVRRGVMLANTRPGGPVYINLDVSVQEAELAAPPALNSISLYDTPEDTEPPTAALARAVEILSKAKRPFFFCGRASRSLQGWNDKIRLVELLGGRATAHMKLAASFPTTHPAFVGETGWRLKGPVLAAIHDADAIIMLDWLDAGNAINLAFPAGTKRPPHHQHIK